jgi:hypothetical protein
VPIGSRRRSAAATPRRAGTPDFVGPRSQYAVAIMRNEWGTGRCGGRASTAELISVPRVINDAMSVRIPNTNQVACLRLRLMVLVERVQPFSSSE